MIPDFQHKLQMTTDRHRCVVSFLLAVLVALVTHWLAPVPACDIGSGTDLICARGFETRETAYGSSFRWSNASAEIHLASVGYGRPLLVDVQLRSGRPAGAAPVPAAIGVNGRLLTHLAVPVYDRQYKILLPATFPTGDIARLQVASETWKPNTLSRTFGLVLVKARIVPTQGRSLPGPLFLLSWLALFLVVQVYALHTFASIRVSLWLYALLLALAALALVVPVVPYLSWLALLVGGSVLVWRAVWCLPCENQQEQRDGFASTTSVGICGHLWLQSLLACVPYGLLITGVVPPSAHAPVLLLSAVLATGVALLYTFKPLREIPSSVIVQLVLITGWVRLVLVASRLLSGRTWVDGDVELFYAYGTALRDIGLPQVEYPTGALMVWAVLSWLSGSSRELFALLLPVLNIACDMALVAVLAYLGLHAEQTNQPPMNTDEHSYDVSAMRWSLVPAALYAFSPLLEPFLFAKYDSLPAVLAIGALAFFAAGRVGLSGIALALGATIKWTPLLAVPFLVLHLLRFRRWRELLRFVLLHGLTLAACSLPFALSDMDAFTLPYRIQGGRGMNAESIWMLVAWLRDSDVLHSIDAPWGAVRSGALPVWVMVGGQAVALGITGLIALLRPPALWRTLALAALAPALFLITNRIFSPQYMLSITAALYAAVALTFRWGDDGPPDSGTDIISRNDATTQRPGKGLWILHNHFQGTRRIGMLLVLVLVLAQVCNLLIWPFFMQTYWFVASGMMFAAVLAVGAWVLVVTVRRL